jgi:hypothetical protein
MMGHMRPAADSYTYDVGVGTPGEIHNRTADILRRFGYEVVHDDGAAKLHMETQWLERAPVDEQERLRATQIVSRVQVIGAPHYVAGAPTLYHALVTVENRYVPTRGTTREARNATSSLSYAQAIVKGMALALGGTATAVGDEQRPF